MMTAIAGVIGMALLFGLFTLLRPGDKAGGCTGNCVGCTRDGACDPGGPRR
jgi:hypothetical protein